MITNTTILKHVDTLERELIRLKRDILQSNMDREYLKETKKSLFGSVRGGDITNEMIEESKQNLFGNPKNI